MMASTKELARASLEQQFKNQLYGATNAPDLSQITGGHLFGAIPVPSPQQVITEFVPGSIAIPQLPEPRVVLWRTRNPFAIIGWCFAWLMTLGRLGPVYKDSP